MESVTVIVVSVFVEIAIAWTIVALFGNWGIISALRILKNCNGVMSSIDVCVLARRDLWLYAQMAMLVSALGSTRRLWKLLKTET